MKTIEKLEIISENNGGIIETKLAAQNGISREMLSRFCKQNKIHRIANGQYIFPDDVQDEFLSIDKRSDKITFSHESALYLNGLSDRTPFVFTVTVPTGYMPSSAISDICKVYYIKSELFGLGKTTLLTPAGNKVTAYDSERTICDIVRSRNTVSTETFLAALKMYAASPKKDLNKLNEYAEKLRIAGVVRRYLEVLL